MTTITGNRKSGEMKSFKMSRSGVLGMIIVGAFLAFEVFNFSTTDFALQDVLGELKFLGMRWSTMLAVAFCAIDFAGIAKMFTPDDNAGMVKETWFLFGAWVLAAGMNAILTWWGVSVALASHGALGASVVSQETMLKVVPVFVAVMVWLIRVLVIGSLSLSLNDVLGVKKTSVQQVRSVAPRKTRRTGMLDELKDRLVSVFEKKTDERPVVSVTEGQKSAYRTPMTNNATSYSSVQNSRTSGKPNGAQPYAVKGSNSQGSASQGSVRFK